MVCAVLSSDGARLLLGRVIAFRDKPPRAGLELRTTAGTLVKELSTGTEPVLTASFSGDGATVSAVTAAGNILVLSAATLDEARRFQDPSIGVSALDPTGRTLVTGGGEKCVRVRPLREEMKVKANGDITGVAFSPDGRLVALANGGDVVDARTTLPTPIRLHLAEAKLKLWQYCRVRFSPDGRFVSEGKAVTELATGRVIELPLPEGRKPGQLLGPLDIDFSPDGRLLALAASMDKCAWVYDLAPPRLRQTLAKPANSEAGFPTPIKGAWATCVRFSPDGQTLALGFGNSPGGGDSGELQLWDVPAGTLRRVIDRRYYGVWAVEFSPDGRTLAAGCGSYTDKGGGAARSASGMPTPAATWRPSVASRRASGA